MPTKRGCFPHLKLLAAQVPGQEEMSRWPQHGTNLLAKDASGHTQAHPCRLPLADRPEADRPTLDTVVLNHRTVFLSPSKKQTTKPKRRKSTFLASFHYECLSGPVKLVRY